MAKTSKKMFSDVDPVVFTTALTLIIVFCIVGGLWPELLSKYANTGLHWLVAKLSWVFVLTSTGFVVFALALAGSRYGRIPLAEDGEAPEYSFVSWAAMMFSAGMGIGLVFFGVYEPVAHLANPAPWLAVEPGTEKGRTAGHGLYDVPLGPAPVGHLRCGGAGVGLFDVSPGPRQPDQRAVPAAGRRQAG